MSKDDKIRRLLIFIGSMMVVIGSFMVLTRGNLLDKSIGYVIITNGSQRYEVEGYKYSYNSGDDNTVIEGFTDIEQAENISELDYYPNDENSQLKISYSKKETANISYKVYDESFECVIDSQPKLDMPGEIGKKYYIEASVDWGEERKNVTVKYYFAINVK